jgi:branched-chain amino acid transport system substrate-binding protein
LLRADLKALGVTPVTDQSFTTSASDLTSQVLAIKKSGATALLSIISLPADYLLLAHQMSQVGVHLTWLGNEVMITPAVVQAGALFSGTYAATPYAPGQSTEATSFDRVSRATFHLAGNFTSGYGYDAVQILARVIRKVGTAPRAIREGILAIRGYRGVMGIYNFDRNGDGLRQFTIVQNVKGRLRVMKVLSF